DVGACHAVDGQCSTNEGVIIWHLRNLTKICPCTVKGTYHAEIIGQHIIINSIQTAYSFSALPLPNNARCIETFTNRCDDQGGVFLQFPMEEPDWWSSNSTLSNLSLKAESSSDPDPVNSKLEYLMEKIQQIDFRSFRELWFHLCSLAERQLWILHQLL
ncbi:MAG: hypothetical protein GY861_24070, partial [bacterium]|nr:hypothetical protein [bacterium]